MNVEDAVCFTYLVKTIMQRGGDRQIFCFVDFANPACAAAAMGALQGGLITCLSIPNHPLFF